jgi:hypothetical protein
VANECISYYSPGTDITGHVATAVTGKHFVKISANRQSGPALSDTSEGGNVQIAPATAASRIFGVARWDGAVGDKVAVCCSPGEVVPVVAGGAIAAFDEVEVGTGATAVTKSSGVAVGYALSAAASGADAQIKLY